MSAHPFYDVPSPDRHDPRGPGAPEPSEAEVRAQRKLLGLEVQAAKRHDTHDEFLDALARHQEWTAQPMTPREGPAARTRPGPGQPT